MRRMQDITDTFILKRWWRLRNQTTLWGTFLKSKYCRRSHPVGKVAISKDSHGWKSLMRIKDKAEPHMIWKIQKGDSSFWWDNWSGMGALAKILPRPGKSAKLNVNSFILNGEWNINKLNNTLSPHITQYVSNVYIGDNSKSDYPVWNLTENGQFSNQSAWNLLRVKSNKNHFIRNVWHKNLAFKVSFNSWRLLRDKLPFSDTVGRFASNLRFDCSCCRIAKNETSHHAFVTSETAHRLWNNLGRPLGIQHSDAPVSFIFRKWWEAKSENKVHKMILQITPTIICWEIWKQSSGCRYGTQKKFNFTRKEQQCLWSLKHAINSLALCLDMDRQWPQLCQMIELLRPSPVITRVLWQKPCQGNIKVNTDGSYNPSNGKAGIGGIVRDSNGNLIMAFSIAVQCNSNNTVEALLLSSVGNGVHCKDTLISQLNLTLK
ncbi:uncharacterized protein LOC132637887 [Lycium barbarum]|uniref:uncharacterized protein LOC132637887 n=1 Tax=Lycium barbarum TaxID=112863 RepID=UPI00293EA36D|nr:uncharacterized protein LOC132637887 [Lycium barbarum]